MSEIIRPYIGVPAPTNSYISLDAWQDDKTVLKNPHKGWYWHFIDNGARHMTYRDGIAPDDHLENFPGLNHLYLRFDWCDIEKEDGVFDFSVLDNYINEWAPYGYTFQLRVCCYETGADMNFATPRFVFEKGARGIQTRYGNIQPDYGDPIFLQYLERMLQKLGERYDNDERIEVVDVGTYGTWGEGHTVEGDDSIYPMDVVKKHIDLHCKYFPNTFVLCNDDHIIGRMEKGADEVNDMLDFAASRGLGVQDDSICCDGYATDCGYDTMRANWAFERLYKNAPSCIEFAHYRYIRPTFDMYYRDGFTIIECLKNSHATYAGFHGYPREWLPREQYLADYCANRLGYWYFVPSAIVPPMADTAHNIVTLKLENRGWSKAYRPYKLKVKVGDKVSVSDFDISSLDSNQSADVGVKVDLRGLEPGKYDVSVGLFYGDRPVFLGIKQSAYSDGFYKIAETTVEKI